MIQNAIQPKFGGGDVKEGVWKCDVCLLAAMLTPWILTKPGLVPCLVQLAIFELKETLKHLHFATVGAHGCAPRVARAGECTAVLHLPRFTHDHSTVLHIAAAASSRSPLSPQLSSLLLRLTPLQSLPIHVIAVHHHRHVKLNLGHMTR